MNILISAGPTLEPIDAVRFISNRSSGKMGVALAKACLKGKHDTVLVHGPLQVPTPSTSKNIPVERASEMMEQLALHMEWADVLIMAAAVCDMRPVHSEAQKIDKSHLHQITMMTNPDIVGTLAQSFPKVHIVSFSLENTFDPERPLKKMRAKKSNWVVYNQLSSMGSDASQFGVIDREGKAIIEAKSVDKELFANMLIDALQQELT